MRSALMVAAGCMILSQAGLASTHTIRLSKPNTTYAAFLDERTVCLNAAWHQSGADVGAWGGGVPPVHTSGGAYSLKEFADCMNAKGYLLDPNGYRAVKYYSLAQGGYLLVPE